MSLTKKAPFVAPVFYSKVKSLLPAYIKWLKKQKNKKAPKVHPLSFNTVNRNTTILPFCKGYGFFVSNGRIFSYVFVSKSIIGYKLGEFTSTRRRYYYRNKKRKNYKKRK